MKLLSLALLASLAIVAEPVAGAAAPAVWHVARSPHFEVYATGAPSRALDALKMFESARGFFVKYLALPESTRRPIRVLVFSGDKEYARYRTNDSADAYYQAGRDHDYIVMRDFNGDSFHTVAHEYAHAALGLKGVDLPPWLAEGLAEFFSSMSIMGNKVRLGIAAKGRTQALRPAGLMSVTDLLAVRRDSDTYNIRDHAGLFYAESWALTHMLMVDDRYRARSEAVVARASAGGLSVEALSQIVGRTPADIDKDLRAYIARGDYPFFTLDLPPPPPVALTPPQAVSSFDASVALAGLLIAARGKDAEADDLLRSLEAERPDDLGVIEARAFFVRRTRGAAAAEPFFARAVDRGSRDPDVLAELGLRIATRDPERASDLLSRATSLAPNNIEIRLQAAAMWLRRDEPDQAEALLKALDRVPPSFEFEYYQILANIHAMAGDLDLATAAVVRVAEAANTPEQVAFAAALMKQVGGPPDMSKVVDGRLMNLDCGGSTPALRVAVGDAMLTLVIDDPKQILIAGGGSLDLTCGEQNTRARVGYSETDPPAGAAGRVRFLDFRKK